MSKHKCPVCDRVFESITYLRIHFTKVHMNGICPICGKKYKSLIRHFYNSAESCKKHAILLGLACRDKYKRYSCKKYYEFAEIETKI